MRVSFIKVGSRYYAKKRCLFTPAVIAKVCGGYMCFESRNDYIVWRNQR